MGHKVFSSEMGFEENKALSDSRSGFQGHNYVLDVCVESATLATGGMIINCDILKGLIKKQLVNELEGCDLSDLEEMAQTNPTPEALLTLCRDRLQPRLPERVVLSWVTLREKSDVVYQIEGTQSMIKITLKSDFSAAHRLHSTELTDAENRELFGKCNNPSGHGHNYGLEATFEGNLDPKTGTAANLSLLRKVVQAAADRFDHKHLNEDCEEFRDVNPTAENVCRIIFENLKGQVKPARLVRVAIRETEKNFFEYEE